MPLVVLIVEDEPLLRAESAQVIKESGFTAITASNADEALAILEQRTDVSIICTDVQMPGSMDGLGLAYAARQRWPQIKIVVVSGQAVSSKLPAGCCLLEKPVPAQQLIRKIRSALF